MRLLGSLLEKMLLQSEAFVFRAKQDFIVNAGEESLTYSMYFFTGILKLQLILI